MTTVPSSTAVILALQYILAGMEGEAKKGRITNISEKIDANYSK